MDSLQEETKFSIGQGDVEALGWSSGQQLAVSDGSGVQLWDVRGSPTLVRTLSGVAGRPESIAFSPDGATLAGVTVVSPSANSQSPPGGWLGVWDTASGSLRAQLDLGSRGLSVAFDRGADLLAVGTLDGVLTLDPLTVRTEQTWKPGVAGQETGPVFAVAFEPDGVLLTGSRSGIVQHWNAQTAQERDHAVLTEAAPVSSLSVAPDGTGFATSGGSSGDVKLWDDASLQQFGATFPGSPGQWGNAQYTPDGSKVVVVYLDGSGAVWPVTLNAWMDHACQVARRNFTQEEWARFVPDHGYEQTCPAYPPG
jgi:WD40 repeat protein